MRELFSFLRLLFVRLPAVVWWTFWYWLRARPILVAIQNMVMLGTVVGRHGDLWVVQCRFDQHTLMKLAMEGTFLPTPIILGGRINVRIDQRGTAWAEPGGPEENAFRTIVALTENN